MTQTEQPRIEVSDPAALREIRRRETAIEMRLQTVRDSRERVEAARTEADALLRAAAQAEAAATQRSTAIVEAAQQEAARVCSWTEDQCRQLTERATRQQADLIAAVLVAVLPQLPDHRSGSGDLQGWDR